MAMKPPSSIPSRESPWKRVRVFGEDWAGAGVGGTVGGSFLHRFPLPLMLPSISTWKSGH